ncbi:MAG TPA: P-loop NTPase [Nocardioidaceae bacterium]|nr:P-loop NTPase [Nocardioidaceae bacterium]
MTTVVENDQSVVEILRPVVGEQADVLMSIDLLRRHIEARPSEYVVVLGPSVDSDLAAEYAEQMRLVRPNLSVILVRKRVDTTILTQALRAGIRDVVEDRDLSRLREGVHRAYALWQAVAESSGDEAQSRRGRVLTVFGNKGGVGKSTLTTNLATALVDETQQRVCVVDLDVACGDVAIMLQMFPNHTLADLSAGQQHLDVASLQPVLTEHSPGLSVLAAPLQPQAMEVVSVETVGRAIDVLVTMFDIVVIDTSGSFDDFALQAFDHSDLVVLIGTLDIPALKSLKLASDTLDLLNVPRARWRLVLNRADSKVGLSVDEVEKTLKLDITAAIPSSRDVPASVNKGEPIVRAVPKHPVSLAIRQLARQLVTTDGAGPAAGVAAGVAAGGAEPRRGSLWRKVRG